MTEIRLDAVRRSFGQTRAVDDITLTVGEGELFTLLGPSGCGKTTLLRIIAGFTELDAGAVWFGSQQIDRLPAHRRDIGMVFQSYAIFPNLTVAGNVAYGLRTRKVSRPAMRARVQEALETVRLGALGGRWPHELSGGQLQRVAIARAVVIRPAVLLFDEPLSNLDAQLRTHMRLEIRQLQQALGITTVYVTHDQEEALAISDRIAVLRAGRIEQVGAPEAIYRAPQTAFVAEFLGSTNLLPGIVRAREGALTPIEAGGAVFLAQGEAGPPGSRVLISVRQESLHIAPPGSATIAARLQTREFLGGVQRLHLTLADGTGLRMATLGGMDVRPGPDGAISLAYNPADILIYPPS